MTLDSLDTAALLRWIEECNSFDKAAFTPFCIEGRTVGAVHRSHSALFESRPGIFQVYKDCINLNPQLDDSVTRTRVVDSVVRSWHDQGIIPYWKGEKYSVAPDLCSKPDMLLERSAASLFGILKLGVHVNGYVFEENQLRVWVARRSKSKPEYPGMLDQLVAGGIPAGQSIRETAIKESIEEANLPCDLADKMKPVGLVSYCMEENHRLERQILFLYDLQLPTHFDPRNVDGEVERFYLWPIDKIVELVATTREFKANCNLVLIDFMIRHGLISPDEPRFVELACGLRNGTVTGCQFHIS